MKYEWKDLPKPMNCFTVRSATMVNLNTRKIIQHYSANTKIVVVQKCITPNCTYYRTREAAHHYLNYAFEASAFGLPNETAPLEHSSFNTPNSHRVSTLRSVKHTTRPVKKQKAAQNIVLPKGGEARRQRSWFERLFRRKNG